MVIWHQIWYMLIWHQIWYMVIWYGLIMVPVFEIAISIGANGSFKQVIPNGVVSDTS
jgi:hypothetical protein